MNNTFTNFMADTTNVSFTENGAAMYKTTNHALLDCNFRVSSWRYTPENYILEMFRKACNENLEEAITWLFFLRDCRGGLGERSSFRTCINWLAKEHPDNCIKVINLIPYYGRWDDLVQLAYHSESDDITEECLRLIGRQMTNDYDNMQKGNSISLLAKWMPSINTSSKETVAMAKFFCKKFGLSQVVYRKALSELRGYLKVVEKDMSANRWFDIDYEKVPAKAAMNYAATFLRHDQERRVNYINKVLLGDAKANMGGLNPYEIWHKCIREHGEVTGELYETVWNNFVEAGLPDVEAFDDCLCVVDTSGSMAHAINKTTTVQDIAYSLGSYFASKAKGPFRDKVISFSCDPEWVDLSNDKTVYDKYRTFERTNWGMKTDILAVFDLVLSAAMSGSVKQEDMPKSLLIVSDMQFDDCVFGCTSKESTKRLFDHIAEDWHEAGYKLPKLIFWSVLSRAQSEATIPMIDCGDNGVALISGYNQNAAKVGASEQKDPMDALLDVLNSERYEPVRKSLEEPFPTLSF